MRNKIIVIIGLIISMQLLSCTKHKLKGEIKVTGILVDAYDQQPIKGARFTLLECSNHGYGNYKDDTFGKPDTTDANGRFDINAFSTTNSQKFISIFEKLANGFVINNKYDIVKWDLVTNSSFINMDTWLKLQLKENETLDVRIELQRLSWLKINITKTNIATVDTLVVKAHTFNQFNIKKDTVVYCALSANVNNRIFFKNNSKEIKQLNINTSLKGDTSATDLNL